VTQEPRKPRPDESDTGSSLHVRVTGAMDRGRGPGRPASGSWVAGGAGRETPRGAALSHRGMVGARASRASESSIRVTHPRVRVVHGGGTLEPQGDSDVAGAEPGGRLATRLNGHGSAGDLSAARPATFRTRPRPVT
jgi:hypothetical protein